MLISTAYAQAGGAGGGGDLFTSLLPFILIFGIFYMLLIRPQQKKAKQHKETLANLKRGDRIVTGGGIIGRIARVEGPNELLVDIAPDVRVHLMRSTVIELVARSEPVAAGGDARADDDGEKEKPVRAKKRRKPAVSRRAR